MIKVLQVNLFGVYVHFVGYLSSLTLVVKVRLDSLNRLIKKKKTVSTILYYTIN